MTEPQESPVRVNRSYPAVVIKVLDDMRVVINRGAEDRLAVGQRFLVYSLDRDELVDPFSKEVLGRVEIVRGTGTITHLQPRMATITSDAREPTEKRLIRRRPGSIGALALGTEEETIVVPGERLPFDDARIGDYAKPI